MRIAALLATAAVAGCGGTDEPARTTASVPSAPTVAPQQIERYVAEFDAAVSERLFAGSSSGVDPADLVGEWRMELNRTLGIIDIRAPDGGGPVLEIAERDGDRLVLKERGCRRPFTVQVLREDGGIRFERVSGGCPETLDLLVARPWRTAPA